MMPSGDHFGVIKHAGEIPELNQNFEKRIELNGCIKGYN